MISGRDFHAAVGERLKRLRLAYGKSQLDFAKTLGVGASAISNYEAGARAVDPYDAFKLKMVYSAPMEWLFGGDESTLPPQVAEKLNQPTKPRGVSEPKTAKPRSTKKAAGARRQA
jgi:transcriptional regulator with XRE-family HTH domain